MKKNFALFTISISLLVALILASILLGSFSLTLAEISDILTGKLVGTIESNVFFGLRLPRTIMALLTGFAMGLAGVVYQTIFKNPLASPDITGVSSGAAFGAAFAIVMGFGAPLQIMMFSFGFGLVTIIALILLSSLTKARGLTSFLLSGIIIKSFFDAFLMIVKTMADPQNQLAAIEFWIMGTLANVTAEKILLPSIVVFVIIMVTLLFNKQITMLILDEDDAVITGLDVKFWRILILLLSTLMVSAVVSVVGTVGFVGLIAPHIALGIVKRRGLLLLIFSMLIGGIITVFADLFARGVNTGAELPLSIPIVLIALPVLIVIVLKSNER